MPGSRCGRGSQRDYDRSPRLRKNHAGQTHSNHPADMNFEESLETTKIHSVMGLIPPDSASLSPTVSKSSPHDLRRGSDRRRADPKTRRGQSLHNGVLFLDELPEFKKNVLEVMRQPLEEERVTIARAATSSPTLPALCWLQP